MIYARHMATTVQTGLWLRVAYDHHAAGTKCLSSCDLSLTEISSAFRHNCMKWKSAKRQVLKISVAWLRGREESCERSWSPWVYEARGSSTVCRLMALWKYCICTFVLCLGILLSIILHGRASHRSVRACMKHCWCWCVHTLHAQYVSSLWPDNEHIQECHWGGRWKLHPAGLNYITTNPDMPDWTLLA